MEDKRISLLKFFIVILLGAVFVGLFIRLSAIKAELAAQNLGFYSKQDIYILPTETTLDENLPQTMYSQDDVIMLAKLINYISTGGDYTEKVAIAATVINRVNSHIFANNLSDVIFEPGAFSGFSPLFHMHDETSFSAAVHAMNGYDPSLGAVFFYETSEYQKPTMRPVTTTIGKYTFTK